MDCPVRNECVTWLKQVFACEFCWRNKGLEDNFAQADDFCPEHGAPLINRCVECAYPCKDWEENCRDFIHKDKAIYGRPYEEEV